ncbi:MAG: hypothetical protein SOX32_00325 [Candidatus Choladocola sp.]|nr:hypothetical protein [Candidatus Choladocola sp.]
MNDNRNKEMNAAKKAGNKEEKCFALPDPCFSKSICSSSDCTGLIPALPSSEEELESYESMYQFCMNEADLNPSDAIRFP